jgi:transcriptional regulator with GAF, ATPase, and Fis domain
VAANRASWWIVVPPALALAYAIAVVIAAWNAPDKGFAAFVGQRVVYVEDGGVADRAGLREGEVIVAADGTKFTGTLDYAMRVLSRGEGETVRLGVMRDIEHPGTDGGYTSDGAWVDGATPSWRTNELVEIAITLEPPRVPWDSLVAAVLAAILLGFGLVARIARPTDLDAKRFYRTAVIYALVYTGALSWTKLIIHPALGIVFLVALFLGPPLSLHLSIDFPHREANTVRVRRWKRASYTLSVILGTGCLVALGIAVSEYLAGRPDSALRYAVGMIAAQIALIPVHTAFGLISQIRAHRTASGALRAQLRWLLFAHALGGLPILISVPIAIADLDRFLIHRYQPIVVAVAILWFVGYGLEVLRIRLADVDALIKSSLGYTITTGAAVGVYLGVVLAAGWLTGTLLGETGPWPHLVAGLVAAALFGPIRARVGGWVDRRFFRDRQHYIEALRHAGESLAVLREPADLAREAVAQIVDAVRAEDGTIYMRDATRPSNPDDPTSDIAWRVAFSTLAAPPDEPLAPADGFAVPIYVATDSDIDSSNIGGWLILGPRRSGDLYSTDDRDLLGALAAQLAVSLANARAFGTIADMSRTLEAQTKTLQAQTTTLQAQTTTLQAQTTKLEAQNAEIRELRDRLEDENTFLRKRAFAATDGATLVGDSKAMRELQTNLERIARSDANVLVLGESGTGKGLLARTLHATSSRADQPFMHVDCGAIATSVFESELFGHERGAFTGATRLRRGPIELADGGTLFLDEIGELPLELQPKLLRVLEARSVIPIGGTDAVAVDVRIVAATHRNLEDMVAAGTFREDLYFRLRVVELVVPPLRARRADIPALCTALLPRVARRCARPSLPLADDAIAALMAYSFPGNVRELENVLERALVLADEATAISAADLELSDRAPSLPEEEAAIVAPLAGDTSKPHGDVMDDIERRRLTAALTAANGNQSTAAKALGMPRTTFINKLRRHGLL